MINQPIISVLAGNEDRIWQVDREWAEGHDHCMQKTQEPAAFSFDSFSSAYISSATEEITTQ